MEINSMRLDRFQSELIDRKRKDMKRWQTEGWTRRSKKDETDSTTEKLNLR